MRDIVSPIQGLGGPFSPIPGPYQALGIAPEFVADFRRDLFRIDGNPSDLATMVSFTRSGTATYVDGSGAIQTAAADTLRSDHHRWNGAGWERAGALVERSPATNLLHTTNALVTQSVTVTAQAYTLHFTGTGTITLSGASTAGPLVGTGTGEQNRVSLTFTPSAGSLTLTVSGTVTNAQLEANAVPTSYIPNLAGSGTAARSGEILTIPNANLPWNSSAVSIAMSGRMSYADNNNATEVEFWRWRVSGGQQFLSRVDTTSTLVGRYITQQSDGTYDQATDLGTEAFSPGTDIPFNIASRHGSTFINGAYDGILYEADNTPTSLPDVSTADLELSRVGRVMIIDTVRVWAADIGDAGIARATA